MTHLRGHEVASVLVDGRPAFQKVEGSEFELEAALVFLAMGFVRQELGILTVSNLLYLGAAYVLGSEYGLLGIVLAYGLQFSTVLLPKCLIIRNSLRQLPAPAPAEEPVTAKS